MKTIFELDGPREFYLIQVREKATGVWKSLKQVVVDPTDELKFRALAVAIADQSTDVQYPSARVVHVERRVKSERETIWTDGQWLDEIEHCSFDPSIVEVNPQEDDK